MSVRESRAELAIVLKQAFSETCGTALAVKWQGDMIIANESAILKLFLSETTAG